MSRAKPSGALSGLLFSTITGPSVTVLAGIGGMSGAEAVVIVRACGNKLSRPWLLVADGGGCGKFKSDSRLNASHFTKRYDKINGFVC